MKLGYFLFPTGHHVAAWRHPDGSPRCKHYRHSAWSFCAVWHAIITALIRFIVLLDFI